MTQKKIAALFLAFFLVGCSKHTFTPLPSDEQFIVANPEYNVIAQVDDIEVMFGFPKEYSGGGLEAIVGVGNTSEYYQYFSASKISIWQGEEKPEDAVIKVLGYDDLQTGVKTKNFFDRLGMTSIVMLAAVGAGLTGHHYETSTFSGSYTGPEFGQGGTFTGSITTHYFDPEEQQRNAEVVERMGTGLIGATKARCANRYAALAAEYLGDEALEDGKSMIKKVVVKGISTSADAKEVTVKVEVSGTDYTFRFALDKLKKEEKTNEV